MQLILFIVYNCIDKHRSVSCGFFVNGRIQHAPISNTKYKIEFLAIT